MYKFAAASKQEITVFGSAKHGFSEEKVRNWLEYMHSQKIDRVCCLLPEKQLAPYVNLLVTYEQEFGNQKVCWTPIEDFTIPDIDALTRKILPFLLEADKQRAKVVVHCSGGIGRTGLVLAAWLVYGRGFSNQTASPRLSKQGEILMKQRSHQFFEQKIPAK